MNQSRLNVFMQRMNRFKKKQPQPERPDVGGGKSKAEAGDAVEQLEQQFRSTQVALEQSLDDAGEVQRVSPQNASPSTSNMSGGR